ncbi:hypothetical protein D3C73_1369650 [compost metagenome]
MPGAAAAERSRGCVAYFAARCSVGGGEAVRVARGAILIRHIRAIGDAKICKVADTIGACRCWILVWVVDLVDR